MRRIKFSRVDDEQRLVYRVPAKLTPEAEAVLSEPCPSTSRRRFLQALAAGSMAGVAIIALPSAAAASSSAGESLEGDASGGSGVFTPLLSSLATTSTTIGTSVRQNVRNTWIFESGGGSVGAIIWQFNPAAPPSEALRTTPRVSLHSEVPTNPGDASASATGLLGVFVPDDATYDSDTNRIRLVPDAPVALAENSTFYAQFYGVSGNVSILLTELTPDPWVASAAGWSFVSLQGIPTYPYAPVVALGTLV